MRQTSASMQARIMKQEVIANNLANINTTGFKKDRIFQTLLDDQQTDLATTVQPITVFEQGALRETQNLSNVAIQGEGFFVVDTAQGPGYTRNGNFQLNAHGQLVTDKGHTIMGLNGPVEGRGSMGINEKGEVFFDGQLSDTLNVVVFPDGTPLKKVGNGLYGLTDPQAVGLETPSGNFIVKQGFVEESNVNGIEEMIRMITVYRNFEADEKVMRTQDEILNQVVNEISRF
ncbi:flagellar hook-basal body protein [bacterium]|nr:flagellar hook-basal body protein [bacterium]